MMPASLLAKSKPPSVTTTTTTSKKLAAAPVAQQPSSVSVKVAEPAFSTKIVDEYDPAKPNDYEAYCQERLRKKREEQRQRDLKRQTKLLDQQRGSRDFLLRSAPGLAVPSFFTTSCSIRIRLFEGLAVRATLRLAISHLRCG